MTFRMRGRHAAFVSALLASAVMFANDMAAAQGADRLAGARSVERMRGVDPRDYRNYNAPQGYDYYRRDRRPDRGGSFWSRWGSRDRDAYDYDQYDPEPIKAHVSSPKYFTYEADQLKTFALDTLARAIAEGAAERHAKATAAEEERQAIASRALSSESPGDVRNTGSISGTSDAAAAEAPSAFETHATELSDLSIRALPEVIAAIRDHYAKNPEFVWVENGQVSDKARAAMKILAEADTVGLDPQDYAVELPRESVALGPRDVELASNDAGADGIASDIEDTVAVTTEATRSRDGELMRFEMEMSVAALTYTLDAQRGRVDPNRISGYHDLPRHDVDLGQALAAMKASDDVAGYLEARSPSSPQFKALVAELAKLRQEEGGVEPEHVSIADGTLIKPGQSNSEVANVVKAIKLHGSETLKADHAATLAVYDGGSEYSSEIVAMVKDYQREHGLGVDGVVGRNTIRALVGVSPENREEKVKLAMERLRWLPRNLGDKMVFINQPAFTATYVDPNRDPLTMRVVVGKKSNQTNFFYDKIETVEFNPYWGVPYSIIVNEMIPKLNRNPYYLDEAGYEVSTVNGRQVSSASVDWRAVANKQQSINVRQKPGNSNALGELKILFPNEHHIYMHDTPQKQLFSRTDRAFSHGCVRLQDPRAMAAAVLGKDKAYVASRIAQGQNDSDTVTADIPVYVSYFTAWPNARTGEVEFFADVYDRDMYLERAMKATDSARRRG